jgi:hypothetical protein
MEKDKAQVSAIMAWIDKHRVKQCNLMNSVGKCVMPTEWLELPASPAKPKTALDNGKTALGPGRKLSIEVFSTTTRSTHSKRVANRSPMIGLAVTKKFSLW